MLNTYLNIYFISYNIKLYEQIFNFIKKILLKKKLLFNYI